MVKLTQHSFLGGQLDWEMMGRQDVEKYQKGATLLKNVVLHKRGAAFKRPGTNYMMDVSDYIASDGKYRLIPFASTLSQGCFLLISSYQINAFVSNQTGSGGLARYEVTMPTGFSSYSGDEVNELDYCQCGDIVYIAHRNHPPAMIKHTVTGTSHSFAFVLVDLDQQDDGIPSISSATVSKLGITYKGPSYTEAYKVTAVFDGVETFPSAAYSNANCQDYDSSYASIQNYNNAIQASGTSDYMARVYTSTTKTYSGTAYTLPWTESQKIALKIKINSRTLADGTTQTPEQIRIYRKTGSFYGLVGISSLATQWTTPNTNNTVSASTVKIKYNGSATKGNALNKKDVECGRFGRGVDGFTVTGAITLTLGTAAKKASVDIKTGHIAYADTKTTGYYPTFNEANVYSRADVCLYQLTTYVCTAESSSGDFDTSNWATMSSATAWSRSVTYNAGDVVTYSSKTYVCKTDGTTGAWSSSKWVKVTYFPTYNADNTYDEGDPCTYNSKTYFCKYDGTTGAWDANDWVRKSATSLVTRTYTYRPCGVSSFKVRLGSGTEQTVSCTTSTSNQTTLMQQKYDETTTEFNTRCETEAETWARGIADGESVSATVEADTASTSLVVTPDTETPTSTSFVIYNVTTSGTTTVETGNTLTWEDKYYTPDVSVTPPSDADVMSSSGNYPGCVCLSQQRLIWASTTNDPARVFMSEIGAFYTHSPHDVQVADDPIDFQVSATQFPKINHIVELKKLVMFNDASEWIIDSASVNSGITFETIRATQHSCIGSSASLKPIVCNNVLLFAERTGQAVRQYGYELEDDGFGGNDISIFSQSIFNEKKIVAWAYQQHPHSTCWCVLSDGTMASLTFNREQQCIAWATHVLGGDGLAKDIVCTQALVGNDATIRNTSEILLLVKRGSTYVIEQFRPESRDETDSIAHFVCMDAVKTIYPGTTTRSGATIVDLSTMQIVSSMGSTGTYAEGYPFDTRITTVYPVVANEIGMAQMDVKCVQYANLRLMRSVGGYVKNVDTLDSVATALVKTVPSVDTADQTASLPLVDERVLLPSSENRDGRITIFQNAPYPFGVILVETDLDVEEHR